MSVVILVEGLRLDIALLILKSSLESLIFRHIWRNWVVNHRIEYYLFCRLYHLYSSNRSVYYFDVLRDVLFIKIRVCNNRLAIHVNLNLVNSDFSFLDCNLSSKRVSTGNIDLCLVNSDFSFLDCNLSSERVDKRVSTGNIDLCLFNLYLCYFLV